MSFITMNGSNRFFKM